MTEFNDLGDKHQDGKIDLSDYQYAIAACRTVDPSQYEGQYKEAWDEVIVKAIQENGSGDLSVYPGSVEQPCAACGITIGVGPRQQAAIAANTTPVLAMCLICAAVAVKQQYEAEGGSSFDLAHLGNRDR